MGNPGAINSTHYTGLGGGGGGHGGTGGNSFCTSGGNTGDTGQVGYNGGRSGRIGKCSSGGAALLIKIFNLQFGSNGLAASRFVTNGSNGEAGGYGERGGTGGRGGNGGIGCCNNNTVYLQGTNGGSGGGGRGADGSRCGVGGHCGTIWLKLAAGVPAGTSSVCQVLGGRGGAGGPGGAGGKSFEDTTLYNRFNINNCTPYQWCTNNGGNSNNSTNGDACNCDEAMCILKKNLTNATILPSGTIKLWNGTSPIGNYFPLQGKLEVTDGVNKYQCKMYSLEICDSVFAHMRKHTAQPLNVYIEFTPEPNATRTNNIHWFAKNAQRTELFEWKKDNFSLVDYTETQTNECYAGPCYEDSLTNAMRDFSGSDGPWGEDTGPGSNNGTSTSNVRVEGNQPVASPLNVIRAEKPLFTLTPNPSSKSLFVEGININATAYVIINSLGQTVGNGKLQMNVYNYTEVDINSLPTGQYYLQILENNKVLDTKKFLKQ
jgi:hypothetical protein